MTRLFLVLALISFYSPKLFCQGEFISSQKKTLKTFSQDTGPVAATLPGISVTNIADGFAKFIVKRGKAEAKLLFVDEFGNKFKTDSFFTTLFPYTSNFIRTDLDLNNGANNITSTLRETVNKDINNLYFNVPKLNYFKNSELRSYYTIVSGLLNKTKSQVTVSNLMSDLDVALTNSNINADVKKRIHVIMSLYSSLVDPATSRMATLEQINQLKTDVTLKADYFKALTDKYSSDLLIGTEITDLTVNREAELIELLSVLTEYNERIIAIYNNIITSADGIKKTISLKDYQNSMIEFIGVMNDILNNDSIKVFSNGKAEIFKNIKVLYDLYFDVKNENYSSAILDLSFLLRQLYDERLNKQDKKVDSLIAKSASTADLKAQDKISNMMVEQKLELLKFLEAIGFYREFLAGMVNAKSSEEIEALIERSALPVGSSILKKKTHLRLRSVLI